MKEYYKKDGITIYNSDNLEVLRNMHSEAVNLIYCDILYNTGKTFDDYNDNLGTPAEAIEWYRPRIQEMRRVLASNGSIFIHCNWQLDSYMRILMDEIFGTDCFRNRIYRKHSEERGFYSNFDSQVDIILYYVKSPDNFVFKEQRDSTPRIVPLFENGFVESMCSNEGDTVADFFMGGGTTAVVTKKLKRNGIFCDISPKACKVASLKLESL